VPATTGSFAMPFCVEFESFFCYMALAMTISQIRSADELPDLQAIRRLGLMQSIARHGQEFH
jgi:hypothetical protein